MTMRTIDFSNCPRIRLSAKQGLIVIIGEGSGLVVELSTSDFRRLFDSVHGELKSDNGKITVAVGQTEFVFTTLQVGLILQDGCVYLESFSAYSYT